MTYLNDLTSLCVAMITDDFIPAQTGVGIHVQRIAQELAKRGKRVIVVTTRRKGQPAYELWEGVSVHRVFSVPVYGFYQALPSRKALQKIFFENKINIVHCHYLGALMLQSMAVAKKMGLPTILTTHMTVDHLTQPGLLKPLRSFLNYLIASIYERFSDVICVSSLYARQVERFDVSSAIHYISNPIDFDGSPEFKDQAVGQPFRILFAGRLNPEKNVGLLIKAFSLFRRNHPDSELLIAGQGDQERNLRQLIADEGVDDSVAFLGHVPHDDLPPLYEKADVFVLPSLVETQGMVALEAMRFRRPVIVTDRIVSAKELVDEGRNGFIVDAYDPRVLAERLEQLYSSPELRKRMGDAGHRKSSESTISNVGDSLENVYIKVRAQSESPATALGTSVEKRIVCPFCRVGTFERRAEHKVFPSNSKRFKDEFFAVWRCGFCRSVHSYAKFPLEEYYKDFPYSKRTLNTFNRPTFESFFRWLTKAGVTKDQRVLFCGFNGSLYKYFLVEKGFRDFDVVENGFERDTHSAGNGNYDVVIIVDFLERVEDPGQILDFVHKRLRAGGLFFLLTVDAHRIKLPFGAVQAMQQPFRLHIPSWVALAPLLKEKGLSLVSFRRRHYLDTLIPFINFRSMHDLAYFHDGSLDSAFMFRPGDIFKKIWRLPRFLLLGFMGGIFCDRSNLMLVMRKSETT